MSSSVAVIGIDGRPIEAAASQRLASATLVIGGARHLESATVPVAAQRVVLGDLNAGLDALTAHDGPSVVLASGDPGFFGIVRILGERGIDCDVFPAVSAVANVCARAGVSWDDAVVISAHGRRPSGLRRAANACRALPKVAVLTAPGSGPAELGAALAGQDRRFIVGENLGADTEAVTECLPADASKRRWADPNIVLVLGAAGSERGWAYPGRQSPAGWALAEFAFEHRDSMVTKSEVRALVVARLGPGIGDLIWDIGAGSGSVAIECARFGAAVSAVERDAVQCERIARNAADHRVAVEVTLGSAPEALADLPEPDAVFIGGGGRAAAAIVSVAAARSPRAIVVALTAIERVGSVRAALTDAGYRSDGVQLAASRLADLPDGSTRLAAQNPVFVLWGGR